MLRVPCKTAFSDFLTIRISEKLNLVSPSCWKTLSEPFKR
jgi:hypothetical protein